MVGHERPGKAGGFASDQQLRKAVEEGVAVLIIEKDISFLDASDHHVVQYSYCV
jgi:hypothetical protein